MEHKGTFGKGLGIGSAIAVIITIICQLFDTGVIPWINLALILETLDIIFSILKN